MALVKCPDCGKMVSTKAAACPECGCPAEFFESNDEITVTHPIIESPEVDSCEYKVFIFKQSSIKYPLNSEKYANLFGDFLRLGFEKFKQLCDVYKKLGNADSIASYFSREAQKLIDEQIDIVLKDLYAKGSLMTLEQFKHKYSEIYLLDYEHFMDAFLSRYNNILGIQQQKDSNRAMFYANRTRWRGGGFGMKGAIKGAMQASILNMGSSALSGLGNAVAASVDEGTIDRKKQALYENKEVMQEICEGIITCMNELFFAYTDELYAIGELEGKINIDYKTAYAKYEAAMRYEKDKEKLFEIVIDCIGLYPAERIFYETIEMELENCEAWNEFKDFWHIEFLYKENEDIFLKTEAKMDDKTGTLKLMKDLLIFEGVNSGDSKKIPIGSIKKVEITPKRFEISLKGKFLPLYFETLVDDIWVTALNNAMNEKYEKYDSKKIADTIVLKEEDFKKKAEEAEAYIIANYSYEKKQEAVRYYEEYVKVPYAKANNAVDEIFNKVRPRYPGTEDLDKGLFRGSKVLLFSGNEDLGYVILTIKELIKIDVKKNSEKTYDVYSISHMKEDGLFGWGINFRYPGKLTEVHVGFPGKLHASEVIDKIRSIQKGNFEI